ncbi:MAG: hypothetical protein ACRYFR_12025 [Janthinobacterium lividum]
MEILLFNDVLIALVKQSFDNAEHKVIVNKILSNENSVFIYSKKMLELLKESLDEQDMPNFQAIVTKLGDVGNNLPSSSTSVNMEEEASHLNSLSRSATILNIAYKNPIVATLPKVAIVSEHSKPNYHWLVCNLAILHPNKVTVNCWDFTNNTQIKHFFNYIYSLSKLFNSVNVFDTQCNLDHDKFDSIIRKTQINYYTRKAHSNRNPMGDEDNFDLLKNKFISNFKMFTVESRRAHGRRIVFNDVVVTIDNDYWNLITDAQDWSIDVQISATDASQWLQRTSFYRQFISRKRR